jgi:predicted component of type VI protein secretion system
VTLLRKFYVDPESYDPTDHIRRNLQALFDGHEGYGSFLIEAGLADSWIEKPDPSHMATLEEKIRQQVTRWEPRVSVLEMNPLEDQSTGRVSIRLQCRIRDSGRVLIVNMSRDRAEIEAEE